MGPAVQVAQEVPMANLMEVLKAAHPTAAIPLVELQLKSDRILKVSLSTS